MDPVSLAIMGGLSLGGQLFSGIGQAQAQAAENRANRRRAARLEDIANLIQSGGEYGNLRRGLSNQLSGQLDATQAMLSARGLGGSGAGAGLAANAMANAQGQYAQAVNEDQLRRQQLMADIFGSQAYQSSQSQLPPSAMLFGGLGGGLSQAATIFGGMDEGTFNSIFGTGSQGGMDRLPWSPDPTWKPYVPLDPGNRRGIFE